MFYPEKNRSQSIEPFRERGPLRREREMSNAQIEAATDKSSSTHRTMMTIKRTTPTVEEAMLQHMAPILLLV
jgi:hypothetical protein